MMFVILVLVSILKDLCYFTIPEQNSMSFREQGSNIMALLGPQPSSLTHVSSAHSSPKRIFSHEPGRKEFCIWYFCATPSIVVSILSLPYHFEFTLPFSFYLWCILTYF